MNLDYMPNINASVDAILSAIENTVPLVQEFLKDTSFPLEDRWSLLIKAKSILPVESYGDGYVHILSPGGNLYDDLYIERRETITYYQMDARMVEGLTLEGEEPDEYSRHYDEMYKNRDEWREAVLVPGYGSFTYDW